ncbi:hypothetical protein ACPOL_0671 [Acidisarcina polymorpha]|uniref:Uncharacterized protein n=1 Tax=Acidisarcina polymorpha TaxID=2211140 RepID=A0A2Z5FT74_9BACT|nr:hypothetical protein ACPOL_0671 [Acidisarcina polymorpha]
MLSPSDRLPEKSFPVTRISKPIETALRVIHQRVPEEAREISSSRRDNRCFRRGDSLVFLKPRQRSLVGVSPTRGRLVTGPDSRFLAYIGSSATPWVESIRDIAPARLSTSWLGLICKPQSIRYRSIATLSAGAVPLPLSAFPDTLMNVSPISSLGSISLIAARRRSFRIKTSSGSFARRRNSRSDAPSSLLRNAASIRPPEIATAKCGDTWLDTTTWAPGSSSLSNCSAAGSQVDSCPVRKPNTNKAWRGLRPGARLPRRLLPGKELPWRDPGRPVRLT